VTNSPKDSLNPLLFGIVIAIASVLVVMPGFESDMTISGQGIVSGNGGNAGQAQTNGGAGGLADIGIAEAEEAGNATMAGGTTNQTTTNGNTTEFLAIQNSQSGSTSQINATAYTLELNNVSNKTALFSDRPNRIVTSGSTSDFIGDWMDGSDSFAEDAPNDVLIVENTQTGQLETAIIGSFDPMYDVNTNTLTYTIITENATSIDLPVWTVYLGDRHDMVLRWSWSLY